MAEAPFEIFLATTPGLEPLLLEEVQEAGFTKPAEVAGGVTIMGDWEDAWRANIELRGPSKVLARIGAFRAVHLAQLDKRSHKFPWAEYVKPDLQVRIEVSTNKRNKIYHGGAAGERLFKGLKAATGASLAKEMADADLVFKVRIEDDMVQISVDTSGEGLHKRGAKQAMGKAPMRETYAALILRGCGYQIGEPVLDPMCGSGTFIIEAAEIAKGLVAGRSRGFAFKHLVSYDADQVESLQKKETIQNITTQFYGSDRNVNVIGFAKDNATRAGVIKHCDFAPTPIGKLTRPEGAPGLVIVNPPYGARISSKRDLVTLYRTFGSVMKQHFQGWRVGMVTSDFNLAKMTGLPWSEEKIQFLHGGLRVTLYHTAPL